MQTPGFQSTEFCVALFMQRFQFDGKHPSMYRTSIDLLEQHVQMKRALEQTRWRCLILQAFHPYAVRFAHAQTNDPQTLQDIIHRSLTLWGFDLVSRVCTLRVCVVHHCTVACNIAAYSVLANEILPGVFLCPAAPRCTFHESLPSNRFDSLGIGVTLHRYDSRYCVCVYSPRMSTRRCRCVVICVCVVCMSKAKLSCALMSF